MGLWIGRVEVQEQRVGAVRFSNTIHDRSTLLCPVQDVLCHTPNVEDPHFAPRLKSTQGSLRHSQILE